MFKTTTGKWFYIDYDLAVWREQSDIDEMRGRIETAVRELPADEQDAMHAAMIEAGETGTWIDGGLVDRLSAIVTREVSEIARDWIDPAVAQCVTIYAEG